MTHPFLQDVWVIKRDGIEHAPPGRHRRKPAFARVVAGQRYVYAMGSTNFWRLKLADGSKEIIGAGSPNGQLRVVNKP